MSPEYNQAEAKKLILDLEFSGDGQRGVQWDPDHVKVCPECRQTKQEGHRAGCIIAARVKELTAGGPQ